MENINILAILVAALIPMVVGFIWYNPKVFGNAWMKAAGMTEEKVQSGNMAVIFGLSFLFALMLAFVMQSLSIHQTHFQSLVFGIESAEVQAWLASSMEMFKDTHRTWSHGAVHGFFAGLFIALPVLATNSLFERKGFKYIAVNGGYWILTFTLMGTIICGWV